MALLEIRTSTAINVLIIIVGLPVSAFLLLFGVANLIHPDVSDADLTQNTKICLMFTGSGLVFLLITVAAFRGILLKNKNARREHKS